jgi:hypothetical protein
MKDHIVTGSTEVILKRGGSALYLPVIHTHALRRQPVSLRDQSAILDFYSTLVPMLPRVTRDVSICRVAPRKYLMIEKDRKGIFSYAMPKQLSWHRSYGVYLGYPECCITHFTNLPAEVRHVKSPEVIEYGGFRPCPVHAAMDRGELAQIINNARVCHSPYPLSPMTTTVAELGMLQGYYTMIAIPAETTDIVEPVGVIIDDSGV